MTPAIFYHPEAYTTTGPKLMGRNAAGESFLRGFLQHSRAERFAVQVMDRAHGQSFADFAQSFDRKEPVAVVDKSNLGSLRAHGVVYHPGPGIADHARQRSFWGHEAWSLCGITHTTSSARAMDSVAQLVTAPVHPWDALICTSSAVKKNVEFLLEREADYLRDRLGASLSVLPKLPIIPLGIHTEDFVFGAAERVAARRALSIADDTLVVMFMGRLSFHAKAHPLPMYLALEEAARRSGKSVTLIECGWHGNESIQQAFDQGAAKLCPSVHTVTLDGRKAEERGKAWAAADVFCSLSDNIQETFGISPIEAMAAGLPVVVSDWDGYKDTVRHGVDGFRVPTIMPRAGLGGDLALRHAIEVDTYDMYIGHACSLTAVDVQATTAAFTALFESEGLRRKMGAAGQARAREVYDWARIIRQYEELWMELNEERKHSADGAATNSSWPARPDPFAAFETYPTYILTEATVLEATASDVMALCEQVQAMRALAMVNFAKHVLPTPDEVQLVLSIVVKGPTRAVDLVRDNAADRRAHVFRGLGWLLKIGALRLADGADLNLAQTAGSDVATRA
jgi:glycosyltransferase involved in cell wall biosynthesis